MSKLYAQPYDMSATGFYFETAEAFTQKAMELKNDFGQPVEEFEIQFIDGDNLDAALAEAWQLNQMNVSAFIETADLWDYHEKVRFIIARENGYDLDRAKNDIDTLNVDIYGVESMRELAEQFVDDGLFGDIPEALANYIDLDAIARDLACDYGETVINGERVIYRCG